MGYFRCSISEEGINKKIKIKKDTWLSIVKIQISK